MALITFKDWRASVEESSATTRARDGWARYGNYPPSAGFSSHSTPAPFVFDKLDKELCKTKPKKRKKK